jgi:hypothetical protein
MNNLPTLLQLQNHFNHKQQHRHRVKKFTHCKKLLHLYTAIQKIKINERDMKTVLVDAKAVLESKLSEIDQRLDKADNVATIIDNSTQSLVQLQITYPWLQVKLRSPPNAPSGACCLCQCHSLQICSLHGYSSMQNWLDCSVVLDSDHCAQRVKKIMNSQNVIKAASQQKNKEKGMLSYFPLKLLKERDGSYRKVPFAMLWTNTVPCTI